MKRNEGWELIFASRQYPESWTSGTWLLKWLHGIEMHLQNRVIDRDRFCFTDAASQSIHQD